MINNFLNFTAEYKFDNLKIKVDNSSGNINYYNHRDFIFND